LWGFESIRLYYRGDSLSEVISISSEWWTLTAQAKAIVGLVLSLQFSHSFDLLHANMTLDDACFRADVVIQITIFHLNRLIKPDGSAGAMTDVGGSSGE
jgi:hypothetical protein